MAPVDRSHTPGWETVLAKTSAGAVCPDHRKLDIREAAQKFVVSVERVAGHPIRDLRDAIRWLYENKHHVKNMSLYDGSCDLKFLAVSADLSLGDRVFILRDVGGTSFARPLIFKPMT